MTVLSWESVHCEVIMTKYSIGLLTALLWVMPSLRAAEPEEWKQLGKFKLPSVGHGVFVSDDHRIAFVITKKKIGGLGPYRNQDENILHCFDVATGKEVFKKGLDMLGGQMAAGKYYFGYKEPGRDAIHVHDLKMFREVGILDCRSPNDSPPGGDKGVPKGFEGVNGMLSDLEFTADGKTLLTVRSANKEWKPVVKQGVAVAWTGRSVQQVTFWDIEKGKAIGTLDCDDEQASDGYFTLLPKSKQMLVKFTNGVRMLDPEARKWGTVFPIKNPIKGHSAKVRSAAFSPDEKKVVVTDYAQTVHVFDIELGKEEATFKVRLVNRQADDNPPGNGLYAFGPDAVFVDGGKVLRVTLNDHRTVVFHDAATGAVVKGPAPEVLKFPGGPAVVLGTSRDRRCFVTAPARNNLNCTVWVRGEDKKE
jgi:DNA-binding beta-propeller fold protein YncE